MPDIFDALASPRFDGIAIPITGSRLQGGQRKHVHSYPHVNKGKPEKLGRELYQIHVQALFDVSLASKYPGIWPDGLNALLAKFEAGTTGALFLPTRGTIRAFCDGWTVDMSATLRSGERADLTFIEDDEDDFTTESILAQSGQDFAAKALTLTELRAVYDAELSTPAKSLFDEIDDAVNQARGVIDTANAAGTLVQSKLERLANLCSEVEDIVEAVQDPRGWPLLEATKELWDAAVMSAQNVQGKHLPTQTYTVPARMTVQQVALAIFGDASRGGDLMELNFFPDAFAISAGTVVSYYPDEAA